MRVSVSTKDRSRLLRVLRAERRDDGLLDLTLLRLDPGVQSPVLKQTVPAADAAPMADGGPVFDTHGIPEFPEGYWPARRTAGGWIALIDDVTAPERRTTVTA